MSNHEASFNEVLRQYGAMLARVAATYEADPALREDLLQEISLALWRALAGFRNEASLKTYVARVAHNRAVDHVLHRKRLLDDRNEVDVSEVAAPVRDRELHEKLDLLTGLRQLPLAYRHCAELMLEGFSHAEIGEALGLAENTVTQRLGRARQMLRLLMNAEKRDERSGT